MGFGRKGSSSTVSTIKRETSSASSTITSANASSIPAVDSSFHPSDSLTIVELLDNWSLLWSRIFVFSETSQFAETAEGFRGTIS